MPDVKRICYKLGLWVCSLSPRERAQAGHFCPAYASRNPCSFIYESQTREWRVGSSRVGADLERREREQKRSGGEGGGSANILVRGIKCSGAFACSFMLRNHWRLLQHLDRRSQAEQSKIAGIGKSGAAMAVSSAAFTQNRYALYRSLRAAPSAMHRQIGCIEKAHLHVRFVASMRETQKRLQRAPQKRPATPSC